jgi:hypothetical protein
MSKFTKCLMTLALMVLSVTAANAAQKMMRLTAKGNYASYTFNKESFTAADYKGFRIEYCEMTGTNGDYFNILVNSKETHLGKDWAGNDAQVPNKTSYKNWGFNPENTVFEGDFSEFVEDADPDKTCPTIEQFALQAIKEGNSVVIKKVVFIKTDGTEVLPEYKGDDWGGTAYTIEDYNPGVPKTVLVLGDNWVDVTPTMYVKNYGETDDVAKTPATPDADGVYTVTDVQENALAWATQFWIAGEYALPAGKKFKVEFDYKASNAISVVTQTHAATPGSYIIWHCIGDVAFEDEWNHFEKEVTIENDMDGWQSIAFNMHRGTQVDGDTYSGSNTTYYFKNIILKEPEVVDENVDFTVGSEGWASFSYTKDVDLSSAKGYAAKLNGSYVELTPVTEVPANNAVLIEGGGKHSFNVIASATAIADNDLKVSDGNVTGDGIYVLANGKNGVGFYKLASGQKVPAGKAYLEAASSAREFIGFDGATGIETVKTAKAEKAEEGIFNLQGQRLMKAQKGLNIINGKKVLVK